MKAAELNLIALACPLGWDRTHYLLMEANWRRLATAAAVEALRLSR